MKNYDEKMMQFLNENNWILATMGEEPYASPYGFKMVLPDGRLAIAAIFMTRAIENIRANGKASISVCGQGEAYRFSGTVSYLESGPEVEAVKEMVEQRSAAMAAANPGAPQRKRVVKGAVVFDPARLTVISPGPANQTELW